RDRDRWYGERDDAPFDRHAEIELVRAFERPGVCPLGGEPLAAAERDLADLRALQDGYLRFPLSTVRDVAEVASLGGFVKQYQVTVDPLKLAAAAIPLKDVVTAIEMSNRDIGGATIERAEHEYVVRGRGSLRGLDDLADVVIGRMSPADAMPG